MDRMTVNMIAGAVLSSLLVIFGMNTFVNILYPKGGAPEAPSADHAAVAPGAGGASAPAPSQPIETLLASANVQAGEASAKKCATCHTFEQGGPNKAGPNLHNILGRAIASHEGFAYSPALKGHGGNWDYKLLDCYKMAFAGLKKGPERADVIAYLRSVTDNPPPLPTAAAQPGGAVAPPAEGSPAVKAQETPSPAAGSTAPGQAASQTPAEPGAGATTSGQEPPANR
jgi:cytochrome c